MWLFWVVMFFYDLNWSMNCLLSGIILKLRRKEISRDHLVVFFFQLVLLFFNYSLTLGQNLILIFASRFFFLVPLILISKYLIILEKFSPGYLKIWTQNSSINQRDVQIFLS